MIPPVVCYVSFCIGVSICKGVSLTRNWHAELMSVACREDGMRTVAESIKRLQAKNGGCVPMLDPTRDLKVSGSQYRKLQGKQRKCVDMLHANHLFDKCVLPASRALSTQYHLASVSFTC